MARIDGIWVARLRVEKFVTPCCGRATRRPPQGPVSVFTSICNVPNRSGPSLRFCRCEPPLSSPNQITLLNRSSMLFPSPVKRVNRNQCTRVSVVFLLETRGKFWSVLPHQIGLVWMFFFSTRPLLFVFKTIACCVKEKPVPELKRNTKPVGRGERDPLRSIVYYTRMSNTLLPCLARTLSREISSAFTHRRDVRIYTLRDSIRQLRLSFSSLLSKECTMQSKLRLVRKSDRFPPLANFIKSRDQKY